VGRIEGLKDGLDPEVLSRWYREIEGQARERAPEELREKINVIQDPDLPMRFRIHASRRAVPFLVDAGYRARIRNHGHSCFLCEIVIRSQFHTTYEPEA
jgi:hypothetical protein